MSVRYYDTERSTAEIVGAIVAIDDVIAPSNNGKVLCVENGKIKAKSVSSFSGEVVLEPLNVTANGDYYPRSGTDGFDKVHVNVSSGGGAVVQPLSVTQNGTYTPPSGVDGYAPITVNVQGGSGFLVSPLQYVTNSHYYTAVGYEYYYSEAVETCASFALTIGKKYVLFLDGNPGPRFRRTQVDTEPFTIVPTNPPAPGSLQQIETQKGVTVGTESYDPPTENPPANASVTFTATKPYLVVHLSLNPGDAPNVYLLEMPS